MRSIRSEHMSYIWLLAGFLLLVFSNGINHIIPFATWIAPVFLIRFLRTQTRTKGLILFAPVNCAAWIIMQYGIYPDLGVLGNGFGIFYGIIFFLPFLADRLMTPRIQGLTATLVFPSVWVTIEFMLSSWEYTGSWFSLAYTQRDNLPLIQLASVTGIWGISFLVAWFASVANWAWEQDFSMSRIWQGISLYLGILIFVLLLGGAYLTLLPADSETVRAATVTRSFDMNVQAKKCKGDIPCLRELFKWSLDEFLQGSKQAVDAGAKIVVWQENGLAVYQDDESGFIERGREFAMREDAFLIMGMHMFSEDWSVDENKAILISPSGQVSEYLKNSLVVGDNHVLGDGKVLIQDSRYGRLAVIICKDADFPGFVRQAGRENVDLMLIPTEDWDAITPSHARMTSFRAIENGFSMIRADYHGLSTAVDYHGNILSQMNDFTTTDRVMLADLPQRGIKTVYSQIGDIIAWLCVFGLLGLIVLAATNRKEV